MKFTNCTVYLTGEFMGNVTAYECREVEILENVRYAQYDNAIQVKFLQKGKRNLRGTMLTYDPYVVVLPGFTPVKPDDMYQQVVSDKAKTPGIASVSVSRYSSCDDRWRSDFDAKVESSGIQPLYRTPVKQLQEVE